MSMNVSLWMPAVYVYVACCRLYYFYMSLIHGVCLVNVHFGDILHTFIPQFTLHSTEKIRSRFSTITTWQLSAFRKILLPVGNTVTSV